MPPPADGAWVPGPVFKDLDHPIVIHQPRRMSVVSGELLVGLPPSAATHPPLGTSR
jgi:hypothetical protein